MFTLRRRESELLSCPIIRAQLAAILSCKSPTSRRTSRRIPRFPSPPLLLPRDGLQLFAKRAPSSGIYVYTPRIPAASHSASYINYVGPAAPTPLSVFRCFRPRPSVNPASPAMECLGIPHDLNTTSRPFRSPRLAALLTTGSHPATRFYVLTAAVSVSISTTIAQNGLVQAFKRRQQISIPKCGPFRPRFAHRPELIPHPLNAFACQAAFRHAFIHQRPNWILIADYTLETGASG